MKKPLTSASNRSLSLTRTAIKRRPFMLNVGKLQVNHVSHVKWYSERLQTNIRRAVFGKYWSDMLYVEPFLALQGYCRKTEFTWFYGTVNTWLTWSLQTKCSAWSYAPSLIHQFIYPLVGDVNGISEISLTDVHGHKEFLPKHLTGMCRLSMRWNSYHNTNLQ